MAIASGQKVWAVLELMEQAQCLFQALIKFICQEPFNTMMPYLTHFMLPLAIFWPCIMIAENANG